MKRLLACLCLLLPLSAAAQTDADEAALWAALRDGGHVALIRHALAPGTGDPPEFRVEDCRTQRNLSPAGRAQARAIGERFRANGIGTAAVFSSQWCRCLDTARALALGEVTPFAGLNSFFAGRGDEARHTRAARADRRTGERPAAAGAGDAPGEHHRAGGRVPGRRRDHRDARRRGRAEPGRADPHRALRRVRRTDRVHLPPAIARDCPDGCA
jgi:hypothetical protein